MFRQFCSFLSISGLGFLLDFGIYTVLTSQLNVPVGYSNLLSGIPAITLVFFVSTSKIFRNNRGKLPLKWKYLLYCTYQLVLLTSMSLLAQHIFSWAQPWVAEYFPWFLFALATATKVVITPISMTCNFFVLRYVAEKI